MIDTLSVLHDHRVQTIVKAPRLRAIASASFVGVSSKAVHNFVWQGKMWICNHCLIRTSSPSLSISLRPCIGHRSWSQLLANSENGHILWSAEVAGGGRIVYCSKCWSYASAFPRNLLRPCRLPPHGRPCSQRFLMNRRHPVCKSPLLRPSRLHV